MGKRRPSGDGLVRKRADGRWEGRIVVGHKEDGKPIYRSVFAEKQGDLMPKLHELKDQYAGVELTEDSSITLDEWLGRWLEEYKKPILRPSTYAGYSKYCQPHPAVSRLEKDHAAQNSGDSEALQPPSGVGAHTG